jgi:hypothetical protein
LVGDELVEIGVGEHTAHAFAAVADGNITKRAGGNMTIERLDRAAQPVRGLGQGTQIILRGCGVFEARVVTGHGFTLARTARARRPSHKVLLLTSRFDPIDRAISNIAAFAFKARVW